MTVSVDHFAIYPEQVIFAENLSRAAKNLWAALALQTSEKKDWEVWARQGWLARKLKCSTRYVRMLFRELERNGFLKATEKLHDGKFKIYQLTCEGSD